MKTKIYRQIRQSAQETGKLLWSFKWYILPYALFLVILVAEFFVPPLANDKIFSAEALANNWKYTNQAVYVGSLQQEIIIWILIFLLAVTCANKSSRIAKGLLLLPWIWTVLNLVKDL